MLYLSHLYGVGMTLLVDLGHNMSYVFIDLTALAGHLGISVRSVYRLLGDSGYYEGYVRGFGYVIIDRGVCIIRSRRGGITGK